MEIWYKHKCCQTVVKPFQLYVGTKFSDGTLAHARPTFTEEDYGRAESLGYFAHAETQEHKTIRVWLMHVEHELLHTLVGEYNRHSLSPVLYLVAHELQDTIDKDYAHREECQVFAAQRLLQTGELQRQWLPGWTQEEIKWKLKERRQ